MGSKARKVAAKFERAQLRIVCLERSCVLGMTSERISSDKQGFAGVSSDLPFGCSVTIRRTGAPHCRLTLQARKTLNTVDGMRTCFPVIGAGLPDR